jgi:proteasome lid subunit RPN8/RPN11
MLRIDRDVYDAIVDHARAGRPEEVCGILGGRHGEDASHASAVERTENVAANPRTEYEIDPEAQFTAMEAIEDRGADVVGFYHSHPAGPPRPSDTDAARATWPDHSYVIVSFESDDVSVGSWRWTGAQFEGEELAVEPTEA